MNELSVYERITDPIQAIEKLGEVLAKSRIFGCESIDQGKVMAWECLARRTPPLQLKETYHLINTSQGAALTMRADAMLAGFLSIGGKHRILQRDGERAAVELSHAGQACVFECTLADAKEAGLTDGKKGEKENWSSPRQRMQMLWARAISDGVRAMAPQVCAGKYTPEDFGRSLETGAGPQDAGVVIDGEAVSYVVESLQPSAVETEGGRTPTARTEPAGTEPAGKDASQAAAGPTAKTAAEPAGECTADQRLRISTLFEQLSLTPDQRDAVLRKRGVSSVRSLSRDQAAELLRNLEAKYLSLRNQRASDEIAAVAGESRQQPEVHQARVDGPCSQRQIDELKKDLLPMLAQSNPDLYAKLTAKIRASGKLADMSFEQARSLIEQLKAKNVEAFFAASLSKETKETDQAPPFAADP